LGILAVPANRGTCSSSCAGPDRPLDDVGTRRSCSPLAVGDSLLSAGGRADQPHPPSTPICAAPSPGRGERVSTATAVFVCRWWGYPRRRLWARNFSFFPSSARVANQRSGPLAAAALTRRRRWPARFAYPCCHRIRLADSALRMALRRACRYRCRDPRDW